MSCGAFGIWQVDLRLVGIVEKGHQGVVVVMGDRIVLVAMALRAAERQPEPCRPGGGHPVGHGMKAKLERIDTAFFVEHRIAMKAGGDKLVERGFGQHVAGELFDRELVEGHVGIEGLNHPVAVGPHAAIAILLVTVGIGVAGQIEPLAGPPLAVLRAGQQPIDETFVRCVQRGRRDFAFESCEFLRQRRQADEVEIHPPHEGHDFGRRGGLAAPQLRCG